VLTIVVVLTLAFVLVIPVFAPNQRRADRRLVRTRASTTVPSPRAENYALRLRLPEQGLIIDGKDGIELRRLDGRVISRIANFHLTDDSWLSSTVGPIVLERDDGAFFLLESAVDHLRPWSGSRTPLALGAALESRARKYGDPFSVVRDGLELATVALPSSNYALSAHRDVVSILRYDGRQRARSGYAIDLRDGRRRELQPGCQVADRRGAEYLLVCNKPFHPTMELLRADGSTRDLVPPPYPANDRYPDNIGGYWDSAAWSPDGARIAGNWHDECDSVTSWVAPGSGGVPRSFEGADDIRGARGSWFLGWTRRNEAIVYMSGGCGDDQHPALYAMTRSGKPTRLAGLDEHGQLFALWGPLP
jgi:hypothetical protein